MIRKITPLLLSLLISQDLMAESIVRVVPRSDYGVSHNRAKRAYDVWSNKGTLLSGQPMGGAFDVVFQKKQNEDLITVSRCLSARPCFTENESDQAACLQKQELWNCEALYQGTSEQFCSDYVIRSRAQSVAHFIADQIIGGIITGPFAFFQKGIGLAATRVSTGYSAYSAINVIVNASCKRADEAATGQDSKPTSIEVKNVRIFTETEKSQVRMTLEIFTPTKPADMYSESYNPFEKEPEFPKANSINLM